VCHFAAIYLDHYAVRFIPRESGLHLVRVTLNGNPTPNSPFLALVGQLHVDVGFARVCSNSQSKSCTGSTELITYAVI
jgi:hypothetical protein